MRVTQPWNVFMAKFDPRWEGYPAWQTGQHAWVGQPTCHVIKLKWEIIWTGGLPYLSGLPHLHGVSGIVVPGVTYYNTRRLISPAMQANLGSPNSM